MNEHPRREWFYDWVVSLWIVWLLAAVAIAGGVQAAVRPSSAPKTPPPLVQVGDVDSAAAR